MFICWCSFCCVLKWLSSELLVYFFVCKLCSDWAWFHTHNPFYRMELSAFIQSRYNVMMKVCKTKRILILASLFLCLPREPVINMQTFKWSSFKLVSCDSQLTQQYHGTLFLCYFEGGNLSGSIYWATLLRAVFLVHGDWPLTDLEHDTWASQEPSVNAVPLCWEEWTGFQCDLDATNVFWFSLS